MPPGSWGAASDDGQAPVLTSEQQEELARKDAGFAKFQKLWAQGAPENEIRAALGLAPRADASPASYPVADSVYMGLWKEPENQPNWCGPGSGMAVLSTFISIPPPGYGSPDAYMAYLASRMMTGNTTTVANWVSVVNSKISPAFYESHYCTGVEDFKAKLVEDISYQRHPINNPIWTQRLPNWAGYACAHYVAANGYNIPDNPSATITYGDSAPDSANGSLTPNPYGRWTWNLNDFYTQLPPANGGTPTIMW